MFKDKSAPKRWHRHSPGCIKHLLPTLLPRWKHLPTGVGTHAATKIPQKIEKRKGKGKDTEKLEKRLAKKTFYAYQNSKNSLFFGLSGRLLWFIYYVHPFYICFHLIFIIILVVFISILLFYYFLFLISIMCYVIIFCLPALLLLSFCFLSSALIHAGCNIHPKNLIVLLNYSYNYHKY